MAPLEADSLFTNFTRDETVEICSDELLKSKMNVSGLNKNKMFKTLSLTLKEFVILLDNEYYSQNDGVTMGSPLGPTFSFIMKVIGWKIARKISNQFITKDL